MARTPAPVSRPVALTVAGSDSGGGAGIQADLKTMDAHGAFGTSVVTSVTAQHTRGVESTHVLPVDEVTAQLDAVLADFDVRASKTGLLASREVVDAVADRLARVEGPLVVDPVMVAASGDRLLDPAAEDAYARLVERATLVTPNADEAAVLTGRPVETVEDARAAGHTLVDHGADAALVTGGHLAATNEATTDSVTDVLVTGPDEAAVQRFSHPRVATDATHGTGCTLSSAVTARLARGDDLGTAVGSATAFLERAVRYHHDVGEGPGAVNHLAAIRERAARQPTAEAVAGVVASFVEWDVSPLVPEVGTNVVGATPAAERVEETAAVEGRLTRVRSGVRPTGGVRFGASSHVARFLLAAREFDPSLRFAANCRYDDDVAAALDALDWPVAAYDRGDEPDDSAGSEGNTMDWGARQAFGDRPATPVAVVDEGAVGKEPMTKVVASDAPTLRERVGALLIAV